MDLGKLQDETEKKAAEEAAEAFKPVLARLKEVLKDKAEDVRVTTRYELRPCEDGLRVRSELEHRGADVQTYALADVSVWRTPPPPLEGLPRASYPSVVVTGADAAYAFVSCDGDDLWGVNEERVSALGAAAALVRPGERLLFERLLLTAGDEAGARAAIDRVRGR